MKFRIFVTSIILAVSSLFLISASHQTRDAEEELVKEAAGNLLSVLGTGDRKQFELYLNQGTDLPVGIRSDLAFSMIFDGDYMRNELGGGRSIIEIIADGEIEMVLGGALDNSFIVSFIPRRYIGEIHDPNFFSDEWMKKFFSCWFSKQNGHWQLHYNLCFAETGGPYRGAY